MTRPSHLNDENAAAFADAEVARLYRHRGSYPDAAVRFLASLAVDEPRRVLDLGCGTGAVARPLVRYVASVDAVDPSVAMIGEGRRQPGGDDPRIRWIVGRAEDAELDGPYALVVAGESLHWMDWPTVLPRCASLLAPNRMLAISGLDTIAPPWHDELKEIIIRHSVVTDYTPYDLVDALEQQGIFARRGRYESEVAYDEISISDYIDSFHARSSLARHRLGPERSRSFDREVAELIARHGVDRVRRGQRAVVTYGKPLAGPASSPCTDAV